MNFLNILAFTVGIIALSRAVFAGGATGAGGTEIKVIEQSNLLTGVYYRIDLPFHSFSTLSWADIMVNGARDAFYIQMDDHEYRAGKYVSGGDWYRDGLWYFAPTDVAGFYKIHNAADKTRIIAASTVCVIPEPEAPADYYLTSIKDCDTNNTYWEVVPTAVLDTYELRNLGLQGLAATTHRFGDFYRWIRINQQADTGIRNSFRETTETHFRFRAAAVSLRT